MNPKLQVASAEITGEFEAVSEAELVHDHPETSGDGAISGVRPSPAAIATRLEAALAASARTEATLADLFRTAKFLSAGITAVREANGELERELEALCAGVEGAGAQRTGLERRIQRLERVVEEKSRDALREREFLMSEHDAFIASLISDHERQLASLRAQLNELELSVPPPPSASKRDADAT